MRYALISKIAKNNGESKGFFLFAVAIMLSSCASYPEYKLSPEEEAITNKLSCEHIENARMSTWLKLRQLKSHYAYTASFSKRLNDVLTPQSPEMKEIERRREDYNKLSQSSNKRRCGSYNEDIPYEIPDRTRY